MSDQNASYTAAEQDSFSYIDDELATEQPVVDDILDADGYQEAAKYGMTPEEERRGASLNQQLAAEVPDVAIDPPPPPGPGDPIPDEPTPGEPDPAEPLPLPDEPAPPEARL